MIKKLWPWFAGAVMIAAVIVILLLFPRQGEISSPTLTIETPQKISLSAADEISLDVRISSLADAIYPAMSMSISFDPSKLEFLGLDEGNLCVSDEQSSSGKSLPDWNCNVDNSNIKGLINIMYLDMTGGRHAFSSDLLQEDGTNVVVRLKFRLRGSVSVGDVLDLTVEDAVFAASDETQSLAMTTDTLHIKDSKIVIGE